MTTGTIKMPDEKTSIVVEEVDENVGKRQKENGRSTRIKK
jgi:hypothetical protein